MPSKAFISYRRSDAGWAAALIQQAFEHTFGPDSVYFDVESIQIGERWEDQIDRALDQCEAALIIIGPTWMTCLDEQTNRPRIENQNDMVRKEVAKALERGIPVVPVLIDDARLPQRDRLPDELQELNDWQGVEIRLKTFSSNVRDLVRSFQKTALNTANLPASDVNGLRKLLTEFLARFHQWSFSATRIRNWGQQQAGFNQLADHSLEEIRGELQAMVDDGVAKTRASKKGGTLYRLNS